ncbi:hypothetical protein [Flavilitoribacter nigricans]|uniref:DUF1574 domain-containing protein n=1 Tax=Flavilitoribacter nigricans (strain ATCC 23147 / DSM 23189 / NBRC 102662 / NCIMB 1420 / SS-2) TaxID=1122177 RepID=A0A2D0NCK8_FLAN2|nr:hypothetical protein [Flavilitoribacter nigricans]PHN06232.1 hypothetical protein CRP01_11670 [Flavilitoribacter nigricans DSM 23189 = NBRC 102662]
MKQFLWIAGFILLVLAGDRLGGYLLRQVIEGSEFRYSRLYTGRAEADLLLLGNSRGLAFYQPYIEEKTQLATLNLSYNGLPINLAAGLVRDYYDHYPAPEKIVIDVSLCDRFDDQLIMNFSPYLPYSQRIDSLIRLADPQIRGGLGLSHLFRYNSEIFQRALYYQNRSDEGWVVERNLSEKESRSVAEDYEFIIYYPEEAPEILADLVRYCQQQGSEVQLVLGPYFPAFLAKMSNLETYISTIEQATGLPVHNFSNTVDDFHLFADFQHLNKAGSKVFIDSLFQMGVLSSRTEQALE